MNRQPLPKIGKLYNCFDDGKITSSRQYQVKIKEIIAWKDAPPTLIQQYNNVALECNWLFNQQTDYFILSDSYEQSSIETEIFARTKDGGWFGIGELFCSGQLDVTGELTECLDEYLKTNNLM